MSSYVDYGSPVDPSIGVGAIAIGLMAPVAVVAGGVWLAYKTGQGLYELNSIANSYVASVQAKQEQEKLVRKQLVIDSFEQLKRSASDIEKAMLSDSSSYPPEIVSEIRGDIRRLLDSELPEDVDRAEEIVSNGRDSVRNILEKMRRVSSAKDLEIANKISSVLDKVLIAIQTSQVMSTRVDDITVIDPDTNRRAELLIRLADVHSRIISALEYVRYVSENIGLSYANEVFLKSCFIGINRDISGLTSAEITLDELEKGIDNLEEVMKKFDSVYPNIEAAKRKKAALYAVYSAVAGKYAMDVKSIKDFNDDKEVEAALIELEARMRRAEELRAIYQKLGEKGYICYAYYQELKKLGYNVNGIEQANLLTESSLKYGQNEQNSTPLPFYVWKEEELTQFFDVSEDVTMQMIVHKDGTVTMQAIAKSGDEESIKSTQKKHCNKLSQLRKGLKENWFILCDEKIVMDEDTITRIEEWRRANRDSTSGEGEGVRAVAEESTNATKYSAKKE